MGDNKYTEKQKSSGLAQAVPYVCVGIMLASSANIVYDVLSNRETTFTLFSKDFWKYTFDCVSMVGGFMGGFSDYIFPQINGIEKKVKEE